MGERKGETQRETETQRERQEAERLFQYKDTLATWVETVVPEGGG